MVEPRKYSTGTKGRIKMHSDKCKEFIRANAPSFGLANEFIESIDPDREERVWQRFQTPQEILPELKAWLGEEIVKPAAPQTATPSVPRCPDIRPASQLLRETEKIDAALQKTRAWLAGAAAQADFAALTPAEAAEAALHHFYREFTGFEPQ
ncbi:MAG: hypothetical protein WCH98_08660 [Verrucomicrobiota bacterium]